MYLGTGKHFIRKVENLGEIIFLEDGSKWKVSFLDKSKSMMWGMGDNVVVTSYIGSIYKITHSKRNESIEATFQS